jgi:hypothetical protein
MALIVEDGTGKADAESYISVADASTYHANRGNAAWAALASDTVREQNLRKASDYMVQVYRRRWNGTRIKSTQALDWPRAFVLREDFYSTGLTIPDVSTGEFYYPSDEVPTEVKNACAELALKAASGELLPDLTQGVVMEKVDVLQIEYDKYSPQSPRYTAIDRLLAPFLSGSSVSRTVVRS